MAASRNNPARTRPKKSRPTVARQGTNFQPHEEAAKRTLAKSLYYRVAVPPSEGSATPPEVSGN